MADVTLRQLQYFVAIVDSGSVTAAAEREHVSQGALSMAVSSLERSLETDLLIRSKSKKVVPTRAGLDFASHARQVLDDVDEAVELLTDSSGELRGTLKVGCSFTLSPRLLPELVSRFAADHPGVEILFNEGTPGEIQDEVRSGRLDLGLVYRWQSDTSMRQELLSDVRLHAVLPADPRYSSLESIEVADFIGLGAILLDVPPTAEVLERQLRESGHDPWIRFRTSNIQTIFSLVARGFGFSLVNSVPATTETFDGRNVCFVPVSDLPHDNAIVAVTAGQHRMPRRVRVAIDALAGV